MWYGGDIPHCLHCGYTPVVPERLPNPNFLDWSDEDMVAFLDGDACNFVAWTKDEVAERRAQLKERYDALSLVRVIQLREPGFKNNRQKRETLVRKLIAGSATDAYTMWRIRDMVIPAEPACRGGRGAPDHICKSSEPLTGDPSVDRDLGKRIRSEEQLRAKRIRLEERVYSPVTDFGLRNALRDDSDLSDRESSSWADDMRMPPRVVAAVEKEEMGDAPAEDAVAGEDDDSESSSVEGDEEFHRQANAARLAARISEGAADVEG